MPFLADAEPTISEYEKAIWRLDRYRIEKSYKLLEGTPPGKILDVGCMGGRDMVALLQSGWDCYGVELSDGYTIALNRGIKCIQHDLNKGIPFEADFFDAIWAEEIIEHILDTDFFLSELNRVLKKNGLLIISTPNLASLINRFRLTFGRQLRYVQYNMEGPGHIRYYTSNILKKQLNLHGFTVEKLIGNFLSIPDPTSRKVFRNHIFSPLGTHLPNVSENLIIKAKKSGDSTFSNQRQPH